MEAKFQEVKEYIRNNPGVSIQDVSENCDVEPSQIKIFRCGSVLRISHSSAEYWILLSVPVSLLSATAGSGTAPRHSSQEGVRYYEYKKLQNVRTYF